MSKRKKKTGNSGTGARDGARLESDAKTGDSEPFVLSGGGKIGSTLPTGSKSKSGRKLQERQDRKRSAKADGKASPTSTIESGPLADPKGRPRVTAPLSNQIVTKVVAALVLVLALGWGFHVGPFAEEEYYSYGQLNDLVDEVDTVLCANRTTIVPCDEDGDPVTEWTVHYVEIDSDGNAVAGTEQSFSSTVDDPIEGLRFNSSSNGVDAKAAKGSYIVAFEYADADATMRWHAMEVTYADSDDATIGKIYATYDTGIANDIDVSIFTDYPVSAEAPVYDGD